MVVVMTSSPGPMPDIFMGMMMASVPVPTPMACGMRTRLAKRSSNSVNGLPSVKSPLCTSVLTSFRYSSTSANCRSR